MALTSMSNVYVSNRINKFFNLNGRVTVNATVLLLETSYTQSVVVKRELQTKLIEVIQVRSYLKFGKIEYKLNFHSHQRSTHYAHMSNF